MNTTIMYLTVHSALGRRRALVLLVLPVLLLGLSLLGRLAAGGPDPGLVEVIVAALGVGTVMPLLGLVAGTSVIAPELEDRSLMYVLAKPISRATIFLSKLAVAIGIVLVLGAAPVVAATIIVTGEAGPAAAGFGVGAAAAGIAYCSLFCMLPLLTRNAVFVGLAYALIWESLVGQLIPGAQALSVQQWSIALTEAVMGDAAAVVDARSAVDLDTGVTLLVAMTGACVATGIHRLRSVRMTSGVD